MAQLNDTMAAQIMGELDAMTKTIDTMSIRVEQQLQSQVIVNDEINKTRKHFVLILDNLKLEVSAFKTGQTKSIQDQLAVTLQSIDAKTKLQLEVLEIGANTYLNNASKSVNAMLAKSVLDARDKAVAGTLEIIEKRFVDALASVAGANKSFEDVKNDFIKEIKVCVNSANTAVSGYATALKNSANNHRPIGKFGVFMLALLASAISIAGAYYIAPQKTANIASIAGTADQANLAATGAKFSEVFQQLDKPTQAKILKIWK